MGACSAPNCKNSTRTGHRMFVIPRVPERRALWLRNLCRADWLTAPPKDYSHCQVCEVHFTDDQFESNRLDNWRKLKCNAVPTVFEFEMKSKAISKDISNKKKNRKHSFETTCKKKPKILQLYVNDDNPSVATTAVNFRQKLLQLQKDDLLCDVVLQADDGQMKAHSVVLAASSTIFKSILESQNTSGEHVIVLAGLDLATVEVLVRFAYIGEILVPAELMATDNVAYIISILKEMGFDLSAVLTGDKRSMTSSQSPSSERSSVTDGSRRASTKLCPTGELGSAAAGETVCLSAESIDREVHDYLRGHSFHVIEDSDTSDTDLAPTEDVTEPSTGSKKKRSCPDARNVSTTTPKRKRSNYATSVSSTAAHLINGGEVSVSDDAETIDNPGSRLSESDPAAADAAAGEPGDDVTCLNGSESVAWPAGLNNLNDVDSACHSQPCDSAITTSSLIGSLSTLRHESSELSDGGATLDDNLNSQLSDIR